MEQITFQSYLAEHASHRLIDVRSPSEYAHAHIPGAINFPLLNDEERAIVGTCYKKEGHKQAVIKGFELVGGKFSEYLKAFDTLKTSDEIIIHCWRGGLRSNIMAWLLEKGGYKANVLKGGYKEYRKWVFNEFESPLPLMVIGGMTGSNKTKILHLLKKKGQAVIDLEGLANHRGSAFGGLGLGEQPSQEMFENKLAHEIYKHQFSKRVWIENESRLVGKCILPVQIYELMNKSTIAELEVSFEKRIQNILDVYGVYDKKLLVEKTMQIEKKLGNENMRKCVAALLEGNYQEWTAMLLKHYDSNYIHSKSKKRTEFISVPYENDEKCVMDLITLNVVR